MSDQEKGGRWGMLGHVCLALSVLVLLMMGPLWERLGVGALILWCLLAGVGVYFLMSGSADDPKGPPD